MAMKCCAKLETAKERCPIVFQGHPSNYKVTRYKTPSFTEIGRFRTIGRLQLSNPSDLPCFLFHWFVFMTKLDMRRLVIMLCYKWRSTDWIDIYATWLPCAYELQSKGSNGWKGARKYMRWIWQRGFLANIFSTVHSILNLTFADMTIKSSGNSEIVLRLQANKDAGFNAE